MKKLIISAGLVGGGITPTQGPYIPITPDEIAEEAKRVEDAGASTVHIHPRNPKTGEPTADIDVYCEILSKIHQTTNLVICPTTGFGRGFTFQERLGMEIRLGEAVSGTLQERNPRFYPSGNRADG